MIASHVSALRTEAMRGIAISRDRVVNARSSSEPTRDASAESAKGQGVGTVCWVSI